MAIRLTISFKDTEEDKKLYDYLQEKSAIMGHSAYIKTLLKKDKDEEDKKK